MYYKDKKYFIAVQEYKKGNDSCVVSELKMLSKKKKVKFDDDINQFITEIQNIAKKKGDNRIIQYTKDVGNKISHFEGFNFGKTSAFENALETEIECKIALKEALKNDEFLVIIDNIVNYISKNQSFHTALVIMKEIHNIKVSSDIFTKKEVALLFIEKMFKVIKEEVKPIVVGKLIKKYESKWPNFDSKEFIEYHKIVELYSKKHSLKEFSKIIRLQQEKEFLTKNKKMTFPYECDLVREMGNKIGDVIDILDLSYDGTGYDISLEVFYWIPICHNYEINFGGKIVKLNSRTKRLYIKSKQISKIYFSCEDKDYKYSGFIKIKTIFNQGEYFVIIDD